MASVYQVLSDSGEPIDAHLELDNGDIVFQSRGGKIGAPNQRNADYGVGLRLVLQRMEMAGNSLEQAWVESQKVYADDVPKEQREVFGAADRNLSSAGCFTLLTKRMKSFGQVDAVPQRGGNSTKRLRLKPQGNPTHDQLIETLKLRTVKMDTKAHKRLPAEQLNKVTPQHVWNAIEKLVAGESAHRFGESTDYDLFIGDGVRLPPKAVFGLAASEALGFEVLPENFSAGLQTPCFRILGECGYEIVPKEPGLAAEPGALKRDQWAEGKERTGTHLRRERAPGLSRAKKALFRRDHGKLKCERCGLDPVEQYGANAGEACIEVHHSKTQVKDMGEGHRTRLEDLQCLCANCHRIVHRELKIGDME